MHATLIAALAGSAAAAPFVVRRQAATPPEGVNDAVILNYALSLEHLENVFYKEALEKFSAKDFEAVGLSSEFYNNLEQISSDEQTHVDFLTTGLTAAGATPVKQCTYKFGYTDVQGFLATANILEGVGVSAYLGAAQYIASPDYLTAAGSILTVESRHSAYIKDNQTPRLSPFPDAFDTPLDFDEVFSLAAQFITGCPDAPEGTLGLPFKAFPAIAVAPAGIHKAGDKLTFTVAKEVEATNAYFITFPGGAIPAELSGSGTTYEVTVPEGARPGQAYCVLTKGDAKPTDDNIVAGPAIIEIVDNAVEFDASHPDSAPAPAPYKPAEKPTPAPSTPAEKPAPAPYKPAEASPAQPKPAPAQPKPVPAPKPESKPAPAQPKPESKPAPAEYASEKSPVEPKEEDCEESKSEESSPKSY